MSNNEFIPYSPQLGITGSSYRLSMGLLNGKWAVRLAKGDEILDSKVYEDMGDITKLPNADDITRWVLTVLVIPNLNPHQIMKTVGFVRQQAKRTVEEKGVLKVSKEEAQSVELEKAPEANISRPSSFGEVKDDGPVDENASDAMKSSNVQAVQNQAPVKRRELPSIPSAAGNEDVKPVQRPIQEESHSEEPGMKCGGCGYQIKFCPCCGKRL